jgi:hypothetical protein
LFAPVNKKQSTKMRALSCQAGRRREPHRAWEIRQPAFDPQPLPGFIAANVGAFLVAFSEPAS